MHLPFINNIQLDKMDQVKLMNRIDTKYWFHIDKLPEILEQIKDQYMVLQIDELCELPYLTVYYDTLKDAMYLAHHNGKRNRYKVRLRTYLNSGIKFLEVKQKTNKGRTIKSRILSEQDQFSFKNEEERFVSHHSPFTGNELIPTLRNKFNRITLVNKNLKERCTIDINLQFNAGGKKVDLKELTIIEIKSDGLPNGSPLAKALSEHGIRRTGFSKYCMGRVLTNSITKSNAFKPKTRQIAKTIFSEN